MRNQETEKDQRQQSYVMIIHSLFREDNDISNLKATITSIAVTFLIMKSLFTQAGINLSLKCILYISTIIFFSIISCVQFGVK